MLNEFQLFSKININWLIVSFELNLKLTKIFSWPEYEYYGYTKKNCIVEKKSIILYFKENGYGQKQTIAIKYTNKQLYYLPENNLQ